MHIIKELVKWTIVPALLTIALIGGARLCQDMIMYQHTITGQAHAGFDQCETSPDEMFNDCAWLDTTSAQVIDHRDVQGEMICPGPVEPDQRWSQCTIEEHRI